MKATGSETGDSMPEKNENGGRAAWRERAARA